MKTDLTLAVSAGDPQGIGPEITAAAIEALAPQRPDLGFRIHVAVGHAPSGTIFDQLREEERLALFEYPFTRRSAPPSAEGGAAALDAFRAATDDVLEGRADALCTAPLAKEAVAVVEPGFRGHTGWLAKRTGAEALMCLASEQLRVMLLTEHLPLAEVPGALNVEGVAAKLRAAVRALREDLGVASPRVALLALNPHAGEGGLIGEEDDWILVPALAAVGGVEAGFEGPFPADGFFRPGQFEGFDAVVACYHDQGLIPLKLLSGGEAVNISFGLPIVRTSPDHGTAFDIAGQGRADAASMRRALEVAADIAARRRESHT